jgi:hypothetical protein
MVFMMAAVVNDIVEVERWKWLECDYSGEYMKEIAVKALGTWRWSKCQSGVLWVAVLR